MHLESILLVVLVGTLVVGAASVLAGRIGVAAPLLLVAAGIALGTIPATPAIALEPDLFLHGLLPPLIYAAALRVPFVDFRRSPQVIALLAVGVVGVSALAVGALVS